MSRLITIVVAVIAIAGAILSVVNSSTLVALLVYAPYASVGTLLAIRRSRNLIGWLLIAIGWAFLAGFDRNPATAAALKSGTATALHQVIAWQQGWSWIGAFAIFVMITVLFPSGHLPTGRWRGPAVGMIVAAWLGVALISLAPQVTVGTSDSPSSITISNPAASVVPEPLFGWLSTASPFGIGVLLAMLAVGCGSMIARLRRSHDLERQQLRWLVAALTTVALMIGFTLVLQGLFGDAVVDIALLPVVVAFIAVPLSVGVAVLRYRLYEIDTIINRAVLYGAVTLVILAVFGVANIALQSAVETWTGTQSALLTGFLGLAVGTQYGPLRRRIRPLVDRLLPGRALLTLLFTDIVGSTEQIVELGDEQWRVLLGRYRAAVRQELSRFGGHEVDTAGDAFFATFERPASGVACALAIRTAAGKLGIHLRTGVHQGECEMRGEKVSGIEVHTAARIMAAAAYGEILLSDAVREAIAGTPYQTRDRGERELKGVPGTWRLFALDAAATMPMSQPRTTAAQAG